MKNHEIGIKVQYSDQKLQFASDHPVFGFNGKLIKVNEYYENPKGIYLAWFNLLEGDDAHERDFSIITDTRVLIPIWKNRQNYLLKRSMEIVFQKIEKLDSRQGTRDKSQECSGYFLQSPIKAILAILTYSFCFRILIIFLNMYISSYTSKF